MDPVAGNAQFIRLAVTTVGSRPTASGELSCQVDVLATRKSSCAVKTTALAALAPVGPIEVPVPYGCGTDAGPGPGPSGDHTVPSGNHTVPSGPDTRIPGPDTVPSGNVTVPSGNVTVPSAW